MHAADLLKKFSLPEKEYQLHAHQQGLINTTFLVSLGGEVQYILQGINTRVFKDVRALMNNIGIALRFLQGHDYQALELIKTNSGENYLDAGNKGCWRLMTYIAGSTTFNTTTDLKTAREAGRIISRFHELLRPALAAQFVDTIPAFHDLEVREKQYLQALEQCSQHRMDMSQKALVLASDLLQIPFPLPAQNLPVRICHNDTKLNNILFSKVTGDALCLIDLDTLMKGYFLYDFGDAVRTIVNTAPEDEKELEKISFSKSLFEAFVEGLATGENLLDPQEVHSLAYGAVYMPLIHGIRALTDYLSDDRYYQVTYENQNLDRAMSLLTFAQIANGQLSYMRGVIARAFPYA